MKFTEIQNEGILDNIAHPIAYAKGVLTPGQSGAGSVAQQQSDNELTKLAHEAMPIWKKQVAGDAARSIESTPARLQQWATRFFEIKAPPYSGAQLTDSGVIKYLKAAYALRYSKSELDDPAPDPTNPGPTPPGPTPPGPTPPGPTPPGPTPPGPTPPGPAPDPTNPTPPGPAPTTANVAPTTTTTPETPPAPGPGKNPLFKDPAVFKTEWDKYVASKGGENYRLISDPEMLILLKSMWKRTGGTKAETKLPINFKNKLTESVLMEDPTYKAFRRVGRMIAEQKMTEPEILKLFGQVETGASAGGGNRTVIGKGKDVVTDVAGAISKAYNGVADKIQKSGPVSGFDVAVDKLTDKLANAAGGQSGAVMTAIKKYREFAKAHPIMQGAIYAGLIALTGLSGAGLGGAAILGGVKAFDKLLLGNKASSSLWSGFVTGATAYGIGQAKAAFSGTGTPPVDQFAADRANAGMPGYDEAGNAIAPNSAPGASQPSAGGQSGYDAITSGGGADVTEYTAKAKDTLSGIAKANNISVDQLMGANPDITNPDVLKAGQIITIPNDVGDAIYQNGVGTNADTMSKIASGEYTNSEISQNLAKAPGSTPTGGTIGSNFNAGNAPIGANGAPMQATPLDTPADALTAGTTSNGSYQQAAPLDAAGNAMKQSSFIDLTSGNSGTMNLPNGSTVPVTVYPEGGMQPRMPMGSEKIIADLNGSKVTAWLYNGTAYVPNFKMESVVFKSIPIKEMIDKKTTHYRWALNESLGKPKPRGYSLTTAGVDLVFENTVRYQRVISYLLSEAPVKASARMRTRQAAVPAAAPEAPMTPGRPELPNEYRPDMPDGSGKDKPGFLSRAWAGAKTLGKQLTTSITAEKLKMNWHVAGKPSDSDALYQFLLKQGVADAVANEVYGQAGLPLPASVAPVTPVTPVTPADTGAADTGAADTGAADTGAADTSGSVAAAGGAGSFGDYKKLRADFEAFQEADGAMAPQVRGVLKDILLTALRTVESQQRKLAQMSKIIRESTELKRKLASIKQRAARA